MQEELLRALLVVLESAEPAALATVVRTAGSTPQHAGARLLLRADGSTLGTVGGGAIEHAVLEALTSCRAGAPAQLMVRELGHDLGMCCGGRMEVYVEPVIAAPRLWLYGAGHVAEALAPLAASVGFSVTVVDEREELNNEARFGTVQRCLLDPSSQLKRTRLTPRDWVLITTHDHALDEQVLDLALPGAAAYVGLIGSRRKIYRLLERIVARRGALSLERLYAPVGLALSATTPQEIAVSIVAELVALRRGADVPHLRAMNDPRLRQLLADAAGVAHEQDASAQHEVAPTDGERPARGA